jgi:co-chaperonin GroES (HSP10)
MYKLTSSRVLIKPILETTGLFGVIIPEQAANDRQVRKGTIIATGPGYMTSDGTRVKLDCEIGETVYYSPNQTYEVTVPLDGTATKLVVANENSILLIG